jgi:hypothetical protein
VYHSKVRIGDSIIELGEAHGQWQPMQSAIYLYVEDVDATYKQHSALGRHQRWSPLINLRASVLHGVDDEFRNIWYLSSWLG